MISYIGIDLGQKGALTIQSKLAGSKPTWEIYPFYARHNDETRQRTLTENDFYNLFASITNRSPECYVTIERPVFMPKNGKKAVAGLHEHFGLIKGMLIGLGITSFWFPTPMQWKKEVGAPGNDKDQMLVKASQLTKAPNLSPITADSVLICEACRLRFRDS
jgi:hypothetical protein